MLALQTEDPNSGPLPTRVTNMASRFLARCSRNKMLHDAAESADGDIHLRRCSRLGLRPRRAHP